MTPKTSSECIDIGEVIRDIKDQLNKINECSKSTWSDAKWTREVLTKIGKLAKDHGSKDYTSKGKGKRGEWLYDLCWLQYSETDGYLKSMPLALESEWGNWDAVCSDFEKLLLARAGLRVMVYGYDEDKDGEENVCQKLKKYFETFEGSMKGDRYLLCCWNDEEKSKKFHFHNIELSPHVRAVEIGPSKSCP